ncbi:MAG TPA: hypothetical protein VHR45_25435 [Thermoanaerobaculia bacterium]|nr:hypothetical protein [Thermoanaerobaculia bacterium]
MATAPAPSAPPAAIIDACALLAPADVEQITGKVSGSLSSTLDDAIGRDPSQCSYPLSGEVPPRLVGLQVRRYPTAEQAARLFHAAESGLRSLASSAVFQQVPQLGDSAFWIGGQLDQLHVLSGTTHLVFSVQTDKDQLAAASALAAKALARLRAPAPAVSRPGVPAAQANRPR